jgi:hypothetical protein
VINVTVYIGGATIVKSLNILVMSDSNPVVSYDVSDLLYLTLRAKIDSNMQRALYKTDLMGISGTLAFSNGASGLIANQINNQVLSIFNYLPYIETLDLSNCSFSATDNNITISDKHVLNLSGIKTLQTLILTNATITANNEQDLIIDVSSYPSIVSVLATGTSVGIKAEGNDTLTTVELGTPTSIVLIRPKVLTPNGVDVTNTSSL